MEVPSGKENNKKIEAFIELQLGKNATELSSFDKIKLLKKKFKRLLIMMVVNLGIVVFFGYSFYFEITKLNQTIFNIIIVFFLLNVFFLGLQWKKLNEAIQWLKRIN